MSLNKEIIKSGRSALMLYAMLTLAEILLAVPAGWAQSTAIMPQDTFIIMEGKAKLVVNSQRFTSVNREALMRLYRDVYEFRFIESIDAFSIDSSALLTFFATNLVALQESESGMRVWSTIKSFESKLAESHWLESGVVRSRTGQHFYYQTCVDLCGEPTINNFFVFELDGKLITGHLQCPLTEADNYKSIYKSTLDGLMIKSATVNRPRLTGF